jgi:hypothetical protein
MRHIRALILLLGLGMTTGALAEMRTYDVEARYRHEVYTALVGVLSPQGPTPPVGRVQLLPTGQLLIDTSAEMHAQVAAVLESIKNHRVEATPRVTLRYWAVLGTKGSPQDSSIGAIGAGMKVPEILSGVLDQLRGVHGDLAFRLYGNATLVSESGQEGGLSGETLNISQRAYVQESKLNVELGIRFEYGVVVGQYPGSGDGQTNPYQMLQRFQQSVKLNTSLAPNEFVVVGENAIRNSDRVTGGIDGTIFYIVQWPVAK